MQVELDKYNEILKVIHDTATQYYDKISDIVHKLSPTNSYSENIKFIDCKLVASNNLADVSKIFDLIDNLGSKLHEIASMVNNATYSRAALHSKSATYTLQLVQLKDTVNSRIAAWFKLDLDMIVTCFTGTVNTDELLLVASTHVNYFIISMIKRVKYDHRLEQIIEKQKDVTLGSINRIPNVTAIGPQSTITCGFMLPTEVHKTYDELKSIAKTGPSVILLHNGCKNPIIFNIEGLTSIDYIIKHDLETPPFAGLNKKIITRYNTVSIGEDSIPKSIEILRGVDVLYTIYENISGVSYRLLKYLGTHELLKENQIKFVFGVSERPSAYHNKSFVNPVDPLYMIRVDKYKAEHIDLSADIIQRRLFEKFVTWFESIIVNIDSNESFHNSIISRDTISSVIIDVLTGETETYSNYDDPEVMCSHIIKFESLCKEFLQLLDKNLSKIVIPDRLFTSETRHEQENALHGYMTDIYRAAIEHIGDRWAEFEMSVKESFYQFIKN